jgi:hypothetical protein
MSDKVSFRDFVSSVRSDVFSEMSLGGFVDIFHICCEHWRSISKVTKGIVYVHVKVSQCIRLTAKEIPFGFCAMRSASATNNLLSEKEMTSILNGPLMEGE